jgi:hypothetical protein
MLFHSHFSSRKPVYTRTTAVLVMLSNVSLTPSIAASAAPRCSVATMGVSLKFGVLGGKFSEGHSNRRNTHSGSFAVRRWGLLIWLRCFSATWRELVCLRPTCLRSDIYFASWPSSPEESSRILGSHSSRALISLFMSLAPPGITRRNEYSPPLSTSR